MTTQRAKPLRKAMEFVLAGAVLLGLGRAVWFIVAHGHTPPPFYYDPSDTWMDWFNTAWWARDPGTYDTWNSIYPPLSFLFLRLFGLDACYAGFDPATARHCDWLGVCTIHGLFALNAILIACCYRKIDRTTALPRAIALAASWPMTLALDRGNVILICFTCFVLAYGPLVRSARLRWVAAGLAINFKVYLIASLAAQLLRRRWLWFEGSLIAAIALFLLSYGLLGRGTPWELARNISDFSALSPTFGALDAWSANTVLPTIALLNIHAPVMSGLGDGGDLVAAILLRIALHLTQGLILCAAIAAWVRPEAVPMFRLTNLGTCFALISSEAGAYTTILILFLTFMERWKSPGRGLAILLSYLICIPADLVLQSVPIALHESFWWGHPIPLAYAITWSPIIRPILILLIAAALSCVTIRDVVTDIHEKRWTHRHRYRHDRPFLRDVGSVRREADSGSSQSK